MVSRLIQDNVPIKGLAAAFLLILCLLWSYFVWDYSEGGLIFASPHDRHLPVLLVLFLGSGMAMLFIMAVVGAWFFIYHDAERRGMNQWLWTLLAIFIPNLLGIVIYLVLRKPLLTECPGCRARLEPHLLYCPHCGRPFKQKCPTCNAIVEHGYQFCAACGASLSANAQ